MRSILQLSMNQCTTTAFRPTPAPQWMGNGLSDPSPHARRGEPITFSQESMHNHGVTPLARATGEGLRVERPLSPNRGEGEPITFSLESMHNHGVTPLARATGEGLGVRGS